MFDTTQIHKTNFLPLRWFANSCNYVSHYPLMRAVNLEYANKIPQSIKWWKLYKLIDIPYKKWGTTYSLNSTTNKENM